MTSDELHDLAAASTVSLPPLLRALWQEAHGNWDAAHALAQDINSPEGAWVHAYLHRREGDVANAAYWYRRAGKPVCMTSAADEWHEIASALLTEQRH